MFPDSFFYLLSIVMALSMIAILQLYEQVKKLKNDIFVLNNVTKRFDIYHQIKFVKLDKKGKVIVE